MGIRASIASVSLLTTTALLAGSLVGVMPASAADDRSASTAVAEQLPGPVPEVPDTQDVPPFGDQLNKLVQRGKSLEDKVIQGDLNDVSLMSITAQQIDPARRGGEGKVDVVLTRRAQNGAAIDGLLVRIEVANGSQIQSAAGDGWQCAVGDGNKETVLCEHPETVPAGDNPAEIIAVIAVDKDAQELSAEGNLIVAVSGTWKGDEAQDDRAGKWLTEGYGLLEVRTPVTIDLQSVQGRSATIFTNANPEDKRLQLIANLGGISDGQVAVRWEQVGGPPTRFLNDAYVEHAGEQIGQIVQLDDLTQANESYSFKVTAESNGQSVSDTVSVDVVTEKLLENVAPNTDSWQELAQGTVELEKKPTVAFTSINAEKLRILGARRNVAPGSQHVLKVVSLKGKIASVQWLANAPDGTTPVISAKPSVSVTAPGTPGASDVIEVIVTTTKGKTYQKAVVISARAKHTPVGKTRADDDPANVDAICSIYKDIKAKKDANADDEEITMDLANGSKLVFKVADATPDKPLLSFGDCNGKYTVKVENAQYTHPSSAVFKNVEGVFSVDGFTMKQADWEIPSKIRPPGMLDRLLIMRFAGEAKAAYQNGVFAKMSGSMTVQPIKIIGDKIPVLKLSWIPLPGGWEFKSDSTVLNFLNDADKTYADPIKDGTLRMSQRADGPNGGTVSMSIDYAESKFSVIHVAVANLQLGSTALGDTIAASGEGTIAVNDSSDRNAVRIQVGCYRAGQLSATCTMFTGLDFKEFVVEWKTTGIKLSAKAAVTSGSTPYEFAVAGDYSNAKNWGFEVSSAGSWSLGNGMALTDLRGRIQRRPLDATNIDSDSVLTASLTGTFTGLKFSDNITVDALTPSLTNECVAGDKACDPKNIRLSLQAKIKAQLPGASAPKSLVVFAAINLKTLAFTFEGGLTDIAFGPKELQLTEVKFMITNDPANMCRPKGTPITTATGPYTLGVQATARVLGQPYTLNANFNSSGVCFWGKRGAFDLANGTKALDGVVAYTTFSQGADIKLADGRTLTLDKANVITVKGSFDVPKELQDSLKIPAGGMTYTASIATDLTSAAFEISYTPSGTVYIYQNENSNMSLTQIGIKASFTLKPVQIDLMIYADGKVFIRGKNGQPDSTTPVGVSIGVGFGTMGISFRLQAGVNSNGQPISNAFGQQGLTVRQLAISAVIAVPIANSELSFNADVNLPPSWGGAIGVNPNAPIKLGFRLAKSNPCLLIQIGTEGSNEIAVDVAKAGVVTAKYFKILIAPSGCNLPSGGRGEQWINPGFAFAFDGYIVGSPVTLILEVGLGDGLKIKGKVRLPRLDLYALQLSDYDGTGGPQLDMDIDTKAGKYDISIDAAVEVGAVKYGVGAIVKVKGRINTSDPNYTTINLRGEGHAVVWPVSLDIAPLVLNAKFAKPGKDKSQNYANGSAAIGFWLLGQYIYASGYIDYRGDKLIQLDVRLGAYFDIWIAALDGRAAFSYCMGWLSAPRADNTGSRCSLAPQDWWGNLKPAIRVDLTGRYRILWWWNDYIWTVYNRDLAWKSAGTKSTEVKNPRGKTRADEPDTTPLTFKGVTPTGLNAMVNAEYLSNVGGDLETTTAGVTTVYKTIGAASIGGNEPCKTPTIGAQWNPTEKDPNPDVTYVAKMNAANDGACGLKLAVAVKSGTRIGTPSELTAVCTDEGCKLDGGKLIEGTDATAIAAKDALLAGLRGLPGTVQANASVGDATTVWAPNGTDRLAVSRGRVAYEVNGRPIWMLSAGNLPASATGQNGAVTLTPRGQLQYAMTLQGRSYTSKAVGKAMAEPGKPILVMNDRGMLVYRSGDVSDGNILWGVDRRGQCLGQGGTVVKSLIGVCK